MLFELLEDGTDAASSAGPSAEPVSLVCFIAHNFRPAFVKMLRLLDTEANPAYEFVVLFDAKCPAPAGVSFENIAVHRIGQVDSSYDTGGGGHTLYLAFARRAEVRAALPRYRHVWVCENDVYYSGKLTSFMDYHRGHAHDLLVAEHGCRHATWGWRDTLWGASTGATREAPGARRSEFETGVLGVIMRFTPRLLETIVGGIDVEFGGYFEALLPELCTARGFSLATFAPELVGAVGPMSSKYVRLVEKDIESGLHFTRHAAMELNKLYHPIKV